MAKKEIDDSKSETALISKKVEDLHKKISIAGKHSNFNTVNQLRMHLTDLQIQQKERMFMDAYNRSGVREFPVVIETDPEMIGPEHIMRQERRDPYNQNRRKK